MAKGSDYRMDPDVDNSHLEFCNAQYRKQHVDRNTKRQRGNFKAKMQGTSSHHDQMTSEQGRSANNQHQPKTGHRNRTLSSGQPPSRAEPDVHRSRTLTEHYQGRQATKKTNDKGRRYNSRQRNNPNQRPPNNLVPGAAAASAQHLKQQKQQPVRHPKPRSLILAKFQSNQSDFLRSDDGRCTVYGISVFPSRKEGPPRERVTSTCKYETDWFENQGKGDNDDNSSNAECEESEPGTYDWTGVITDDDPTTWVYWTETVEKLIAKTPVRPNVKPWERPQLFSWEIDPRNPNCLFDYSSPGKLAGQNVAEADEECEVPFDSSLPQTIAKTDVCEAPIDSSFEGTVDPLSPVLKRQVDYAADDPSASIESNRKTNTVHENMLYADELLDRVLDGMDVGSDTDTDFN